jgi:cytochrome b subunit of formate dehydrogenase
MNLAILKTMILSMIFMGVVILLAGVFLLFYKQQFAPYMRYLLPIPPIGVASYVFVYNMFAKYEGRRPGSALVTLIEVTWASGISLPAK